MSRRPATLIYGVDDKVPFFTSLMLSLQHILFMSTSLLFPALVVTATLGNQPNIAANITQATLIAMGVGTLLLTLRKRWIGSGFLCPSICEPAYLGIAILAVKTGGVALLFGMGLLSGISEVFISFFIKISRILIPPEVTGVVIIMVGINLITPVIQSSFHAINLQHLSWDVRDVILFLSTFIVVVIVSIWGTKKLSLYSIITGAVVGYILSLFLGKFPQESILELKQASFFALPSFHNLAQFKFSSALMIPFFIGALSASIKAIGNITTAQKINDAEWQRPEMNSIRNTVFTEGVCTIFSSFIGGMPLGTSSSNVGYSKSTEVTSRFLNIFIGSFVIVIASVPKFYYIFVLIPTPVRGALLLYVICFIIIAGIQVVTSRMLDNRKILVITIPIILGLAVAFIPGLTQDLPENLKAIFSSSLTVATLAAFFLNLIFRIGVSKKAEHKILLTSNFNDQIWDFMQVKGGLWGALPSIIHSTSAGLIECSQAIIDLVTSNNKEISLQVIYDEYNLTAKLIYQGKALNTNVSAPPQGRDFAKDSEAVSKLAVFLLNTHTDELSVSEKDNLVTVEMKFLSK